jgi:hypothetical protein
VNGELTSRCPPTRPPPFATDAANDPETAKTLHSTIRWNKIADVKIMVDSEVRTARRERRVSRTTASTLSRRSLSRFVHSRISTRVCMPHASNASSHETRSHRRDSQALANVRDRTNGNRPLHIAAQNGHLELVRFLVGAGADVNARNKGGQTAMHMATSYDLDQVVKVLNDAGADGSIENNDGFEARWGLSGEKDPTSTNYHVEQFQGASDEATLAKCLDALLKKAEAGEVDKQTFPAIGLKVKKANAASGAWTPAVQAKFVAVVQAEPPSFG